MGPYAPVASGRRHRSPATGRVVDRGQPSTQHHRADRGTNHIPAGKLGPAQPRPQLGSEFRPRADADPHADADRHHHRAPSGCAWNRSVVTTGDVV
jgi:hypothetical protein